jgi:hypothetical protein
VVKTDTGEILGLKENGQVEFRDISDQGFEPVTAEQTLLMEASIGPNSHLRGHALGDLSLRRRYGVYAMAVHRNDENLSDNIDDIRLQFADTLLLEGPAEGIQRLMEDGGIINLSVPSERPMRRAKAPIARHDPWSHVVGGTGRHADSRPFAHRRRHRHAHPVR